MELSKAENLVRMLASRPDHLWSVPEIHDTWNRDRAEWGEPPVYSSTLNHLRVMLSKACKGRRIERVEGRYRVRDAVASVRNGLGLPRTLGLGLIQLLDIEKARDFDAWVRPSQLQTWWREMWPATLPIPDLLLRAMIWRLEDRGMIEISANGMVMRTEMPWGDADWKRERESMLGRVNRELPFQDLVLMAMGSKVRAAAPEVLARDFAKARFSGVTPMRIRTTLQGLAVEGVVVEERRCWRGVASPNVGYKLDDAVRMRDY